MHHCIGRCALRNVKRCFYGLILGVMVFGLLLPGCAKTVTSTATSTVTAKPIVWQWDHGLSTPNTVYDKMTVVELPKRMKEATGGLLQIEPLVGVLPAADTLATVRDGRAQGGTLAGVYVSATVPMAGFSILPFLIRTNDELLRVYEATKTLANPPIEAQNVKILGVGPLGGPTYVMSKDPMPTLATFKGQKIRSWGAASATMLQAFGASPVSMAFGEVYMSVQRGMVTASGMGLSPGKSMMAWEVLKYVNEWPVGNALYYHIVNKDSWNALPKDLQTKAQGVFDSIYREIWDLTTKENGDHMAELIAHGMVLVQPTSAELQNGATLLAPMWNDWVKTAGADGQAVLDIMKKTLGK